MSAVGMCTSAASRREPLGSLRARCETNGSGRDCRILNLTPGSAFVESFVPVVSGSQVKLHFWLPNGKKVSAAGVVRRHEFRVGFDVDFTEMTPQDYDHLTNVAG